MTRKIYLETFEKCPRSVHFLLLRTSRNLRTSMYSIYWNLFIGISFLNLAWNLSHHGSCCQISSFVFSFLSNTQCCMFQNRNHHKSFPIIKIHEGCICGGTILLGFFWKKGCVTNFPKKILCVNCHFLIYSFIWATFYVKSCTRNGLF